MNNLNLRLEPITPLIIKNTIFHYVRPLIIDIRTDNVTIITSAIVVLMKDRTASVLSTDCANKLGTICLKIRFSSHVKAVNRNSSVGYSLLSHFSVDNRV